METKKSNSIIIKNATFLYIRMFISMAIGFYTSRVVLQALGVEDFGLFNIIAGVIVLMSSMNGSLSSASSRFMSFNMGDKNSLNKTFTNAFLIHLAVSAFVLIIGETVGLWFINTQLTIDPERVFAANCVYQATLVSTVLGITQIPYNASIIAHERMNVFAVVEILNSILKLVIALCVLYVPFKDSLIQYSLLYTLVSIIIMLVYRFYCSRNFPECHVSFKIDRYLVKQMLEFIGWNMFSEICFSFRQQGLNVILNRTFGTILNAAAGVALQVQAILYGFIGNITTAFKPQIIKNFAEKNYERCNELILTGAKFTSFFMILISLPVLINLEYLMSMWLGDVPEGAVVLGKICIIQNIVNSFNAMPSTTIVATGKLKKVCVYGGIMHVLCIVAAFIALKFTHLYYIVYVVSVLFTFFFCVLNILLAKQQFFEFSHIKYIVGILLPMSLIFISNVLFVNYLYQYLSEGVIKLLLTSVTSTVVVSILTVLLVLDKKEKNLIVRKIKKCRI